MVSRAPATTRTLFPPLQGISVADILSRIPHQRVKIFGIKKTESSESLHQLKIEEGRQKPMIKIPSST